MVVMFVIMFLSGILSTMNVWADSYKDIRISLNDIYMTLLMNGWMFLFMGVYYKDYIFVISGLIIVGISILCIRTQFLISDKQYMLGMIPHHSMAVHMSKKLLEKIKNKNNDNNDLILFAENIIKNQESEINYMKQQI